MATTIRRLVLRDVACDISALEAVAREVLQRLEDEELVVTFGVWEDCDGLRFVCRVETPLGDPLGNQPPWRWWSSLFRTPEELRAEMAAMVARRTGREGPGAQAGDQPGAASAAAL